MDKDGMVYVKQSQKAEHMLADMKADLEIVDTLLDTWKAENKQLKAANTRLREALEKIASSCQDCPDFGEKDCEEQVNCENKIAKQALKGI